MWKWICWQPISACAFDYDGGSDFNAVGRTIPQECISALSEGITNHFNQIFHLYILTFSSQWAKRFRERILS